MSIKLDKFYKHIIRGKINMNNIVISLFILVANAVAILLTYHSFGKDTEKTKKLFYTLIAMGIMYILILIIYFLAQ